jgi:thioredoxin-like negative regulator of GroEL
MVALALVAPLGAGAANMPWAGSLKAAMNEAKRTDKLVMVDLYTDWCGWCKRLDAVVFTDPNVVQTARQVIPVRVDAEHEGLTAARHFGVTSFPTILFINQRGALIGKITGFEYADSFAKNVSAIAQRHSELAVLESRLRAKPEAQLASKLTMAYAREADQAKAVAMMNRVEQLDPTGSKGYLAGSKLSVGGMFEDAGKYAQATALFHSVLKSHSTSVERAYAHISLAECSLHANHTDAAIPELKATLATADCPPNLQQVAQYYLGQIQSKGKH